MDEKSLTMTVEQAGKLLGISRGLAYQLANQGSIPILRLGKRLLVPRQAILKMLDVGSPEATGAARGERIPGSGEVNA